MTAHWGIPDPAEAKGSPAEVALAFKDAYRMLFQRIGIFTALPLRSLDHLSLQNKVREIGQSAKTLPPVTLKRYRQFSQWGFALAYAAVMGVVMALSFGDYGRLAIPLVLLPGFILGCLLIAIAKLSNVRAQ